MRPARTHVPCESLLAAAARCWGLPVRRNGNAAAGSTDSGRRPRAICVDGHAHGRYRILFAVPFIHSAPNKSGEGRMKARWTTDDHELPFTAAAVRRDGETE